MTKIDMLAKPRIEITTSWVDWLVSLKFKQVIEWRSWILIDIINV